MELDKLRKLVEQTSYKSIYEKYWENLSSCEREYVEIIIEDFEMNSTAVLSKIDHLTCPELKNDDIPDLFHIRVKHLLKMGKMDQVRKLVQQEKSDLREGENNFRVMRSIAKALFHLDKGDYQHSRMIIEQLEPDFDNFSLEIKIRYLELKTEFYYDSEQYEMASEPIIAAIGLIRNTNLLRSQAMRYIEYINLARDNRNLPDEQLDRYIEITEEILGNIGGEYLQAKFLFARGSVSIRKSQVQEGAKYFEEARVHFQEHQQIKDYIDSSLNIVGIDIWKNKLEAAETELNQLSGLLDSIENKFQKESYMSLIYLLFGNLYLLKSDMDLSEENYLNSLKYLNPKIPRREEKEAIVFYNLSLIYFDRGELAESRNYLMNFRELISGSPEHEAGFSLQYANIVLAMERYDEALDAIERGLEAAERLNQLEDQIQLYYRKVKILVDQSNFADVSPILAQMDKISRKLDAPILQIEAKYARAYYLRAQNKAIEQFEALEIYRDILNQFPDQLIVLQEIYFPLMSLLLKELKINQDHKILDEMEGYIGKMYQNIQQMGSKSAEIEFLLIQAEIDLINGKLSSADDRMKRTKNLVKQFDLHYFDHSVKDLEDRISSAKITWQSNFAIIPISPELLDTLENLNQEYDELFHSLRFSIMKVLDYHNRIPRSQLMAILDVASGSLEHQLKRLVDLEWVNSSIDFVDNKPRRVVEITTKGYIVFDKFRKLIAEQI